MCMNSAVTQLDRGFISLTSHWPWTRKRQTKARAYLLPVSRGQLQESVLLAGEFVTPLKMLTMPHSSESTKSDDELRIRFCEGAQICAKETSFAQTVSCCAGRKN